MFHSYSFQTDVFFGIQLFAKCFLKTGDFILNIMFGPHTFGANCLLKASEMIKHIQFQADVQGYL